MKAIQILVFIILILSVQTIPVIADTGDDNGNLTGKEETTRGFVFIIVGTILGAIGYKGSKKVWGNIDESENSDRSEYYLSENLMKLSIILLLLGIILFIGGFFHIL